MISRNEGLLILMNRVFGEQPIDWLMRLTSSALYNSVRVSLYRKTRKFLVRWLKARAQLFSRGGPSCNTRCESTEVVVSIRMPIYRPPLSPNPECCYAFPPTRPIHFLQSSNSVILQRLRFRIELFVLTWYQVKPNSTHPSVYSKPLC